MPLYRRLELYCGSVAFYYFLNCLFVAGLFICWSDYCNGFPATFLVLASLSYAGIYLLPAICAGHMMCGICFFLTEFLLLTDHYVYKLYNTHIDWCRITFLFFSHGIAQANIPLAPIFAVVAGLAFGQFGLWLLSRRLRFRLTKPVVGVLVAATIAQIGIYGLSKDKSLSKVLRSFPVCFWNNPDTPSYCQMIDRDKIDLRSFIICDLRYPLSQPISHPLSQPYNVIWLVADSIRYDVLTPEIMPHVSEWSAGATTFSHHYSSGNLTIMSTFGMLYGLPSPYQSSFATAHREPFLFSELRKRGYDFHFSTTFPLKEAELDELLPSIPQRQFCDGPTWQQDQDNVNALCEFTKHAKGPFFAFSFLYSTHYPYSFPSDNYKPLLADYEKNVGWTTPSKHNVSMVKNRYINSCHYVDSLIDRILQGIPKDTIIIITSDHGEEFYDKRWLFHGQEATEEQMHVPFIMYVPNIAPEIIHRSSSHLDIAPTLVRLLGVDIPAEDFSVGQDLFSATRARFRIASINMGQSVVYMTDKYKAEVLASEDLSGAYVVMSIHDANDNAVTDVVGCYNDTKTDFAVLQEMLCRFKRKPWWLEKPMKMEPVKVDSTWKEFVKEVRRYLRG